MGLCSSIVCSCAISSSTMSITGDGSPSDPWEINTDTSFFTFDTYDDLPDPSTIPDLTGFLVREASEMVMAREGEFCLPGTVFARLMGTPSQTAIDGTVVVDFSIDSFSPNLPLVVSGGDLQLHQYFAPAEIAVRGVGFLNVEDGVLIDNVAIDSSDVAAGSSPFEFRSYSSVWNTSDEQTDIIPIFGVAKPEPEQIGAAPLVISGSPASFTLTAAAFDETLPDTIYVWVSLTWNTFSVQGQA